MVLTLLRHSVGKKDYGHINRMKVLLEKCQRLTLHKMNRMSRIARMNKNKNVKWF